MTEARLVTVTRKQFDAMASIIEREGAHGPHMERLWAALPAAAPAAHNLKGEPDVQANPVDPASLPAEPRSQQPAEAEEGRQLRLAPIAAAPAEGLREALAEGERRFASVQATLTALRDFARHDERCTFAQNITGIEAENKPCDCGFDDAERDYAFWSDAAFLDPFLEARAALARHESGSE